VVRTGVPLALERAATDPAYRPPVDDPAGSGEERLAIQPVRDRDQHIHAVLFAVREAKEPPFTPADVRLLQSLAEAWQPYVHQLAQESHARAKADELNAEQGGELFRQEAISHMIRRGHEGDVVRINPAWVSGAYWIVLASLIAAGVFSYFVRIHQYSEGPAIVKATGRSDVIAVDGGTVIEVAVANGDVVKAGQVVARLHDTEQAGRLRGLDAEYERRLVAYLQSPGDRNVGEALGKVVSDRDEAKANVDARAIRAPYDGRIKDLRVRKGQRVDQGTAVAAIVKKDVPEALSVIAFLPGSDRPRLRAHQQIRLSLPGYRGVHFTMEVRAISSEVLGAKEASSRYFGDRIGDSLGAQGSVVVVEGRLATASFEAEGQTFELHDGMIGRAEVQLDSKSVLATILPGIDL
jgi:multidrug efflux pump subunit AcrA (membrane-fusion protein)